MRWADHSQACVVLTALWARATSHRVEIRAGILHSGDNSDRLPHGGELGQIIHVFCCLAWRLAVFVEEHGSGIREKFPDWAAVAAFATFAVASLALAQWKHALVGKARRNSVKLAGGRFRWVLTCRLGCACNWLKQ